MAKKNVQLNLPMGATCEATITEVSFLEGEETLSEVWWTLQVAFPGGEMDSWESVFFLKYPEGSEALLRELDAFGVTLEHADDFYDAFDDAEGRTIALSGPPDAEGRCAHVALPRRRWRPTARQRRNQQENYGFDRPHVEYGESRYVPRPRDAAGVLERDYVGVAFDQTWYLKA